MDPTNRSKTSKAISVFMLLVLEGRATEKDIQHPQLPVQAVHNRALSPNPAC